MGAPTRLQGLNTEYPDARVMFAASGLPQTFQVLIAAGVTHPDRLFRFRSLPLVLSVNDARYAVVEAARRVNVAWEPEAADMVVEISRGYPAHLQVFADQAWMTAAGPGVITAEDARAGLAAGAQLLERESFAPRFDGLSDREREFLTALAVHGGESARAVLAVTWGRPQQSLSRVRDDLITAGDIYAPRRGELALTVPVFVPYLLSNCESARERSSLRGLLSLQEMTHNIEAAQEQSAEPGGLPISSGPAPSFPRGDEQGPGPDTAPDSPDGHG